ncbi:DNA modification methylase [Bellilinea caldifistulae]|uniref:DNA methyltransferase n=1 Tax=Bellilinea caldifistulae TaxID=360411 RepID=UPI0007838C7A|nr:DNA methyltransferase [Bellilinea caldifistulae]GAP12031.1 DNA modification methylase [Bellilinea caldifistulae]
MIKHLITPDEPFIVDNAKKLESKSLDFALLISGGLGQETRRSIYNILDNLVRALKPGGILFVQGLPFNLPSLGVYLDQRLNFKYWIALESRVRQFTNGLPSVHAGLLMFVKGHHFEINKIRTPHEFCKACGKTVKDWGGKAHLMNPAGAAISDVWKSLDTEDNYTSLSEASFQRILSLVDVNGKEIVGWAGPAGALHTNSTVKQIGENRIQYQPGLFSVIEPQKTASNTDRLDETIPGFNVVLQGDALEILKKYPNDSIDLVFADPPYNLDKSYNVYNDELAGKEYLEWCNQWLAEYIRVLKPTGSLFVLNLPRWSMYHADYLNQRLYFQNWIVWDALSEPRGKLMPAHYSLLFYTKQKEGFTFNYEAIKNIESRVYCLRASCIRNRKLRGENQQEMLSDIWWDIHRIKHRRDRDWHPCQLPEALLKRIILLTTNPNDVVLDALAGTGTTIITAAKLNRRFVGIDIDPFYVELMQKKIQEVQQNGEVLRPSIRRSKTELTKKELQLELRSLARKLGRLPTPQDVETYSQYDLKVYLDVFPTWGKAIKAAKLEIADDQKH